MGAPRPARDIQTDWSSRNSLRWNRPGFDQTDNHPVTCVSIRDAIAYAEWLSRETGHTYRLPSAAEWQYVARAGSSGAMLWRNDEDFLSREMIQPSADMATFVTPAREIHTPSRAPTARSIPRKSDNFSPTRWAYTI